MAAFSLFYLVSFFLSNDVSNKNIWSNNFSIVGCCLNEGIRGKLNGEKSCRWYLGLASGVDFVEPLPEIILS
jgi:hypothetical protein